MAGLFNTPNNFHLKISLALSLTVGLLGLVMIMYAISGHNARRAEAEIDVLVKSRGCKPLTIRFPSADESIRGCVCSDGIISLSRRP